MITAPTIKHLAGIQWPWRIEEWNKRARKYEKELARLYGKERLIRKVYWDEVHKYDRQREMWG